MQVQAAIPEPRFNRFRCVHRDLVFRGFCFLGGPSDSDSVRFLFRCFAGCFAAPFRFGFGFFFGVSRGVSRRPFRFGFGFFFGVSRGVSRRPFRFRSDSVRFLLDSFSVFRGCFAPFETTVEFVQTKHTDSRALAHAITHNRIIKHTVTVPRSRTSETIA